MKSTRILFIGNSFTNRNDLPGMLTTKTAVTQTLPEHTWRPVFSTRRSSTGARKVWRPATQRSCGSGLSRQRRPFRNPRC